MNSPHRVLRLLGCFLVASIAIDRCAHHVHSEPAKVNVKRDQVLHVSSSTAFFFVKNDEPPGLDKNGALKIPKGEKLWRADLELLKRAESPTMRPPAKENDVNFFSPVIAKVDGKDYFGEVINEVSRKLDFGSNRDHAVLDEETVVHFPKWRVRHVAKNEQLRVLLDEQKTEWISVEAISGADKVSGRISSEFVRFTEPKYASVQIIIIGALLLIGVVWQIVLVIKDKKRGYPRRVVPAATLAVIVVLGCVGYGIICSANGKEFNWFNMLSRALVVAVALCAKSYFGPVFGAYVLGTQAWFYFEYDHFEPVPFVSALLDWLFEAAPEWLSMIYLVAVTVYGLGGAVWDSGSTEGSSVV